MPVRLVGERLTDERLIQLYNTPDIDTMAVMERLGITRNQLWSRLRKLRARGVVLIARDTHGKARA